MTAKPLEVSPPKPLLHSHGLHPQCLPSQPFCLWSCGCKHIGLKSKFSACVLLFILPGDSERNVFGSFVCLFHVKKVTKKLTLTFTNANHESNSSPPGIAVPEHVATL